MGVESKELKQMAEDAYGETVETMLGVKQKKPEKFLPYPEKTQFRIFVGCMDDEDARKEYENLLTTSFRCQNDLSKSGDLAVLNVEGTFDKMGGYHVMARYAILP